MFPFPTRVTRIEDKPRAFAAGRGRARMHHELSMLSSHGHRVRGIVIALLRTPLFRGARVVNVRVDGTKARIAVSPVYFGEGNRNVVTRDIRPCDQHNSLTVNLAE